MNIEYLIQILENKLNFLAQAKDQAQITGDLERINTIEAEILGVKDTLFKLKLMQDLSNAAANANTSFSEVMTVAKNQGPNPDWAIALDLYDISSYAVDPLHEQKIRDILQYMPQFNNAPQIQDYIQSKTPVSPVTGQMVFDAALRYSVDIRLIVALMELDSFFGTLGVGATTFNPGNVGNTGTTTQSYSSWEDGVAAVAAWLNNHRKINTVPVVTPEAPIPVSETPVEAPVEVPVEVPTEPASTTEPSVKPELTKPLSLSKTKGKKSFFRKKA